MLLCLEDQIGPTAAGMTPVELHSATHWPTFRTNGCKLPAGTAKGPIVAARVNHGRWLTDCPFCPSANLASRTDRRFLCCECGNAGAGGQWLPVVWPAFAQAVEDLLMARPDRHTRNWLPGESVADLAAENKANGVI